MALSGISDTLGFSTDAILKRLQNYIGSESDEFNTYISETLSLAQFRFCKAHDWGFLRKQALSLSVTNGTSEYTLDVPSIGFYMSAENVETIFAPDASIVLKRIDLGQIRRADPESDDGDATIDPQAWAPTGDNKLIIWPPDFKTQVLKIDGKISPTPLNVIDTLTFPTIPYRYQETFIEYIKALALDRENDDKDITKKAEVLQMVRQDIQDDLRMLSSVENPRIKHWSEASLDGAGANLEAILFGLIIGDHGGGHF